jgi:hypothetical protein
MNNDIKKRCRNFRNISYDCTDDLKYLFDEIKRMCAVEKKYYEKEETTQG